MWVLDHLEDIDSDMSAFHRVDDARATLPAPVYFARAQRLGAYAGVMQARIIERQQDEEGRGASPSSPSGARGQVTTVDDSTMLDRLSAEGWVERG